jgi:hypothetical protein
MAKAFLVNPLAIMGAMVGYNRPLDRHDFPHGSIPDAVGRFIPGVGELRRFANLSITQGSIASGVDTFSYTSTQQHPLGTLAVTKDGRVFRYAQVGAVALVAGELYQSAAPIANHLANTPPAVAIGATSFSYTPGATAGAANLYAEGTLMVDTTPGNGYSYRISGHAAISASTAFTLYLDPDEPIQVALTTSSRVGLHHNPWKNIIETPTTNTGKVIGFAVNVATAAYYTWVQTRGPVAALINGTPAITAPVCNSGTTAGAVDTWTTAAAAVAVTPVGYMMQVGVSGKNNAVFATID